MVLLTLSFEENQSEDYKRRTNTNDRRRIEN